MSFLRCLSVCICLAGNFVSAADAPSAEAARDASSPKKELPPLTPEAEAVMRELRESLAPDSEPIAMLDSIMSGQRLGPEDGWFKIAVSQTRFPWSEVARQYDRNSDSAISLEEFGGSAADFARLDRNGDQSLTAADFDWSQHSLHRTPGYQMFFAADADANGKVTPEELTALFLKMDADGRGFLALDDLKDQFSQEPPRSTGPPPDAPSRSTLILGLKKQEIGSLQPGPSLGERAPDFTLQTVEGETVTLSDAIGEQPVVLIFGNFTCGPFRSQAGNIEKLYERYRDRAKFYLIYVREAHPTDGWWMTSNERVGIDVPQPASDQERKDVAKRCRSHLSLDEIGLPFLVDHVDDRVGAQYSGMPNRLYLIDQEGRIAFKNGRGPFGFKPRELEQALVLLLRESQQDGTQKTAGP